MATPITDENAAQFLKPVMDDVIAQVRGIVDPLKTEVAAMKSATAPPQEPQAPAPTAEEKPKTGIPEGVDISDPASVAAHAAKLEAQAVDWNDPAAVAAYQAKLNGGSGKPEPQDAEANKAADLERKIQELQAEKARLEKGSNQGGDGVVTAPANKALKIDSIEAGHAIGDIIRGFNKKEA